MKSERGFTLIEVVVAFVIAALVVVAALQVFGGAFDGSARAEQLTRALVAAESKISEVGVTIPLEAGEHRGVSGGMSWTARIEPSDGLGADNARRAPLRAYEVTVAVTGTGFRPATVTLQTLKVGPR